MNRPQLIGIAALVALALLEPAIHSAVMPSDGPGAASVLLLWSVTIAGYFFPSIIAWRRGHHQTLAIFLLNLLLGWTGLGWIGALVWAATAIPFEPRKEIQ